MVSEIVSEIQELTALNKKGVEALYEAEMALAKCEADLDRLEAQAYLEAQQHDDVVLAEFWRVELLSRLVMVCDGIGGSQ